MKSFLITVGAVIVGTLIFTVALNAYNKQKAKKG